MTTLHGNNTTNNTNMNTNNTDTLTAPQGTKSLQKALIRGISWEYRDIDGLHLELCLDILANVLSKELGIYKKVKSYETDTHTRNRHGSTSLLLMNNWADRYNTDNTITYYLTKGRYIMLYIYDNNENEPEYNLELCYENDIRGEKMKYITFTPNMYGWGSCHNTIRRYMGHCQEESEGYYDVNDVLQSGYTDQHISDHGENMEEIHADEMANNISALREQLYNNTDWTNFIK